MFRVLQWADSHLNNTGVSQVNSLISSTPDLDLPIHCGDITSAYYQQGIGSFDQTKSTAVVGNHDTINQSGADPSGYRWYDQPTQTELYNRYFASMKTTFSLDIVANTTWWSKEFTDKKILFLGINDCVFDSNYNNELAWIKERVVYAEKNGLTLAIAKHGPATKAKIVSCNFSSTYMKSADYTSDTSAYVETYKGNSDAILDVVLGSSCKVLYVLVGHEHSDAFATVSKNDGSKIPFIYVGGIVRDSYNNVSRGSDALTSAIVCNMIDYKPETNSLVIYRLGATGSASGIPRKMLAWSYSKNAIVSTCGLD